MDEVRIFKKDGIAVVVEKVRNQNKCQRCWKYTPDVGKIKQHPEVCLRCADAIDYMIENSCAPDGSFKDWRHWLDGYTEQVVKQSKIYDMEATTKLGRYDMVYMSEEEFKELYD